MGKVFFFFFFFSFFFLFFFFFFNIYFCLFIWLRQVLAVACGIQFLNLGWNPGALHWELRVLATGPLGKPLLSLSFLSLLPFLVSYSFLLPPFIIHPTTLLPSCLPSFVVPPSPFLPPPHSLLLLLLLKLFSFLPSLFLYTVFSLQLPSPVKTFFYLNFLPI